MFEACCVFACSASYDSPTAAKMKSAAIAPRGTLLSEPGTGRQQQMIFDIHAASGPPSWECLIFATAIIPRILAEPGATKYKCALLAALLLAERSP